MLSRVRSCPVCHREYTDEALNFCLADGAFLSAPNDPQPTLASPVPRSTEPPTELLPAAQIPQTIAARDETVRRKQSPLPWLILGLLAVAFVVYLALPKGSPPSNSNTPSAGPNNETRDTPPAAQTPDDTKDGERVYSSSEVTVPAIIRYKPKPLYTEEARKNQVNGTVVLRAVLSSSGQVTDIRPVSGLPHGLTEKAVDAARQIKFTPATKNGRFVSQRVQLDYNFSPR